MPTLTFIRHAETELNKVDRFAGRTDCNVTPEGIEAAKKAFREDEKNFDVIYRSPLKRTAQTLDAILPNASAIVDERIIEADLGDWEGHPVNTVSDEDLQLYRLGKLTPPNGETRTRIDERVCSFIEDVFRTYTGNEKILIVAHGGVMCSIKQIFVLPNALLTHNLEKFTISETDFERYEKRKKR